MLFRSESVAEKPTKKEPVAHPEPKKKAVPAPPVVAKETKDDRRDKGKKPAPKSSAPDAKKVSGKGLVKKKPR